MMDDLARIRLVAKHIGITRLCHFTQSRKLAHILTELDGIWSTARLKKEYPDLLDQTDFVRQDGYKTHICCSIEYPNTWYLDKIRHKDPLFKDWVVLFLDPSLLWREQTLFCPRNAAAERGRLVQAGYESFKRLYEVETVGAYGKSYKRSSKMLTCCPTDDQAEVLVLEHITCSDIIGIAVETVEQARVEGQRLSCLGNVLQTKWYVAPDLFGKRWSDMVRQGQRPTEDVYQEPII
ncbi:MAG: DUF4433 domain-containing protein [Anaerolineae bacterium]|nr:DUF4433 domain-containing protein [Anaerolineae bacterium]